MRFKERVNSLMIKGRHNMSSFIHDEKGDTNFISILVILGIALALAAVFLSFKDQVLAWVDNNIGDFFSKSGGR